MIPGFAGAALTPDDLLDGKKPGRSVVIYDDDHYCMANAMAVDHAHQGHQVHIVSSMPTLAGWLGNTLEYPRMIAELLEAGVTMYPNTAATAWQDGTLRIRRADTGADMSPIEADSLLSVTIRLPRLDVHEQLSQAGVTQRVIGDAGVGVGVPPV
ncbi:MAG: hypothetical protein AAF943_17625 [Pseudomonadota bacterium]